MSLRVLLLLTSYRFMQCRNCTASLRKFGRDQFLISIDLLPEVFRGFIQSFQANGKIGNYHLL